MLSRLLLDRIGGVSVLTIAPLLHNEVGVKTENRMNHLMEPLERALNDNGVC